MYGRLVGREETINRGYKRSMLYIESVGDMGKSLQGSGEGKAVVSGNMLRWLDEGKADA